MGDWVDEEYERRLEGRGRALDPNQHAAVNARYPGCTLEYCFKCGKPTGKAGAGEDSIFDDEGNGPFCDTCHSELEQKEGALWDITIAPMKYLLSS